MTSRRGFLPLALLVSVSFGALAVEHSVQGKLTLGAGGKPAIETPQGLTYLSSDADTTGVLTDSRLTGADFEVIGQRLGPDSFQVGPIHKKSMWVHRDGKRYMVTYWCEVCAIRTYTPGICQCCQDR